MANAEYWVPLTHMQYEEGRARRLHAEEIIPKTWYTTAHIVLPEEDLSCYAIEFLVEAKSIKPVDDLYVVEAYILDADGQRTDIGDSLIKPDGLMIEPAKSSFEGYLLDAAEKLGLGPLAISEAVELTAV